MKRIVTLLFAGFLFVHTAGAQKVSTFIALHGGFGSAQGKDAKLGSGIGIDFQMKLTERLHFNVKPTLNARGYNGSTLISAIKATYIDLPVNLEADLDANKARIYIGGGPYIGFAIGGKYKNNLTGSPDASWTSMKFGETANDNRSSMDAGFNLNVGALFEGYSRDFKAGIQTMVGLKNVVPDAVQASNDAIKLRNITAYIAFGLTKRK